MGIGVQRNKPCKCGSGKKFKKCCLESTQGKECIWLNRGLVNTVAKTQDVITIIK